MDLKKLPLIGRLALLTALAIVVVMLGSGCVGGLVPIGWSGGVVANGILYAGSQEGRLVSLNLADGSRLWAEPLVPVSQPGLFGCGTSTAGCGGGTTRVPIYGTPVVSGGLVYMAGYNGKVYAYAADSLRVRWVYPREGNLQPIVGGIISDGERLFFGGSEGKVYALDAATGDKLWEFTTKDKVWATPALSGSTLYIGSFDKKLYALDAATGGKKWEFTTQGAIIATPLVADGTVYFGSFDRNLYALSAADGSLKWSFRGNNWFWAQVLSNGGAIYAGSLDKSVYILSLADGALIKSIPVDSPIPSSPVLVGNTIIFATESGTVFALDTLTRQIKWENNGLKQKGLKIYGPLCSDGSLIYIHTQDGMLQRINAANGELLTPVSLYSGS